MSTFEETRSMQSQQHFEVIEFDIPILPASDPVVYKTLKFTTANAPVLPNGEIYRCIKSISENTTEIQSGKGLASRGKLTLTFNDFKGDPNKGEDFVTDEVYNSGTFFGKLYARQYMTNNEIRVKLYRVEPDGSIDLVNGAQTRYYLIDKLISSGNSWQITGKDELSAANVNEKLFPPAQAGILRQDIDDQVTTIPVDSSTDYSQAQVIVIGDEFMGVTGVNDNMGTNASLTVNVRGSSIFGASSGKLLTKTDTDDHSGGDSVFICYISDDQKINEFLEDVLISSDVPSDLIPSQAWSDEVNVWHPDDKINTIWYKSEDVNEVLSTVLTDFLIDIVFDPEQRLINMFAISVWKESASTITEGEQINFDTVKFTDAETERASRALVIYDKKYLGRSDDTENFAKASTFSIDELASELKYGEHKDKQFDNSRLLSKDSADLLTQRYVSRFGDRPRNISWETSENKLDFNVGDVVDLRVFGLQDSLGVTSSNSRAQITKINPKYTKHGRVYNVKSSTFEVQAESGSAYTITGNLSDNWSFYGYAGNPVNAVELTYIFDGNQIFSTLEGNTSAKLGNFVTGSTINIILINGADWQSIGGRGGSGESIFWEADPGASGGAWRSEGYASSPSNGGTCFSATNGVNVNIYLEGDIDGYTANGTLRAPSGGSGGFQAQGNIFIENGMFTGDGGGAGIGNNVGTGGLAGYKYNSNLSQVGNNGFIGSLLHGIDGQPNDQNEFGLAGKAIESNGGIITVYGGTSLAPDGFARLINGSGDAPIEG